MSPPSPIAAYEPANLREILDQHAIVSIADETGRILEVNGLFCITSGYRPDELIGQDYKILNSGQHPSEFFQAMWRTLRSGRTWHGAIRNRRKDGGYYWVQSTIVPFRGSDSQPYYLSIHTDVTATIELQEAAVRSEHALSQTRQLLSDILQGDPVPTFVIDANHTVIYWNRGCEVITGALARDIVGTHDHWRAFYDSQRPLMADLILDQADEEALKRYYGELYRPSEIIEGAAEAEGFFPNCGENGRWLHFTAAPLRNTQGEVIGAVETLQDITERKNAENALRMASTALEYTVEERTAELQHRYDELSDLNKRLNEIQEQLLQSEKLASIGQLAAGVAHEINNPIGFVHSNINTLSKYLDDIFRILDAYIAVEQITCADGCAGLRNAVQLKDSLDLSYLRQDIAALMSESRDGIARVRKIIQDLKDFSRVDSSHEWEVADLHRGLDSTLNMVFNEIKYKADVVREYGEIPAIDCIPSQLNQVFMNLMVNAGHAMDENRRGTLTLRTGRDANDDTVWVEISDNGCGIPTENLQRIFDPFFTTKPVGKGTGLGLSLSYGIVKQHNGDIAVTSAPGQGTTFRITLPVRRAAPTENATQR